MTRLLRDLTLLSEALDASASAPTRDESKLEEVARTLEWALNLNDSGWLALARELGTLRARQEAAAEASR